MNPVICSTRSTSSAPTGAAIRPRRCSRCGPGQNHAFRTTTRRPLDRRHVCSSRPRTSPTRSRAVARPYGSDSLRRLYTDEKVAIGRGYLWPRQWTNGLRPGRDDDRRRARLVVATTPARRRPSTRTRTGHGASKDRHPRRRGGQPKPGRRFGHGPRGLGRPKFYRKRRRGQRPGRRHRSGVRASRRVCLSKRHRWRARAGWC